jgi:hypothetical protein
MTIGTNWSQIIYWIDSVGFADFVKWLQMMHMNDIFTDFAIDFFEIKATNNASGSVMRAYLPLVQECNCCVRAILAE